MSEGIKGVLDSVTNIEEIDESKYKKYLFIGLGVLIGCTVLALLVGQMRDSNTATLNKFSGEVYAFENGPLDKFKTKKIEATELITEFNSLLDKVDDASILLTANSRVFSELAKNDSVQTNLMAMTEKLLGKTPKGTFAQYVYTTQLSALYENNGNNAKALESLKSLKDSEYKVDQIYKLNLARLYLANSNKEEALNNLKAIIKNHPDSEQAKMAYGYAAEHGLSL